MSKYILPCLLSLVFALSSLVSAGIVRVPQDQLSIQAGINAAANGDTVLVADSTYYENINFLGKAITVASYMIMDNDSTHRDSTIINGSQPTNPDIGSVVSFVSGEDTTSVLYGFTITRGTGTLYDSDNRIGGGIYYENSGACIVHNKIISNTISNVQRGWGGAIGTYPWLQDLHQIIIKNNIIESNTINGNDRTRGGGICLIQGKISRNKIRFNACSSVTYTSVGGGIECFCDTTFHRTLVVIDSNLITYNQTASTQSAGIGGGVDIQFSNVHLLGNVISHNKVSGISPAGCGIRLLFSKEISIVKDNIVLHNSYGNASDCIGGGLVLIGTRGVTIEGNYFINNISNTLGGGIYDQETSGTTISDNEFVSNRTDSSWAAGGGVLCYLSDIVITRNLFKGNSSFQGGGLVSQNCNLLLTNNLFTQNKAYNMAGAIGVGQEPPIPIINEMWNNTIIGNVADSAAGIMLGGLNLKMLNTICWGNIAAFAPEIYVLQGIMDVSYSDIRFGSDSIEVAPGATLNWLSGNINTDPQFVIDDSLYHLLPDHSNPCVNTGTDSIQINGKWHYCPPDDYEGDERPFQGVKADIGADETPVPPDGIELQPVAGIPSYYTLSQNYPNPFNPTTTIEFALPRSGLIKLEIYNILGEKVSTLVSKHLMAGNYKYEWDAKDLASGLYFYRMESSDFVESRKMLLIR